MTPQAMREARKQLRLFVVGESSPFRDDWSPWGGWVLVIAESASQAADYSGMVGFPVSEVSMEEPVWLISAPSCGDD